MEENINEIDLTELGEEVIEYTPTPIEEREQVNQPVEVQQAVSNKIEGFDKEFEMLDAVMNVRYEYLKNNKDSIISGALSGKELEAANSMLSSLASEATSKIKLVKDSSLAEAKQNTEATMLAMMSHLLSERTNNLSNVPSGEMSHTKLEVKKLDNFELTEDEIKMKGD